MSRTIRRKNAIGCYGWNDKSYRFHTDMYWLMNAPKECRQPLNRSFRAKNKQILRIGKTRSYEGLVFIPYKHTADWECW